MIDLVPWLARRLEQLHTPQHCLVAVSGGPDSVALLDLLHRGQSQHGRTLSVAHVDHGIHPDSGLVAAGVSEAASVRQLPYFVANLALPATATETMARRARRAALRELMHEAGASSVLLGHHADDQVETVLLRVLRGSGPAGLAGMAPRRGPWLRPLLSVPRQALTDHLISHGLESWSDPANSDPRHLRSWLRTEITPELVGRLPDLRDRLLALARQAGAARQAWDTVPSLLAELDMNESKHEISVAVPVLRGYRSVVQDAVIAALGRRFGVPLGARRLAAVRRLVAESQVGRVVHLSGRLHADLSAGRLTLRRPFPPAFAAMPLPEAGTLVIGPHRIRTRLTTASGRAERHGVTTVLPRGEYVVRAWQRGDRISPLGGTGSRAVSVLLREAHIAAGRRHSWPVVVAANEAATILWVPGICRSAYSLPVTGEESLHVECDLA
jgi:tRNA(Ile)-lysidine synthase